MIDFPPPAHGPRLPVPFDPVNAVCARWFPHLDLDVPRLQLACWLGNHERLGFDDPCWVALIAPPSSLKTVLLTALSDATGGYIIDSLTPQTLISGLKVGKKKRIGLLHQLGDRPNLFIKDLSGILSKRGWDRDEIIGQLRGVFDGEFARPTGTGGKDDEARWRGRMTLQVGVTPVIDIYHALNNQLGERFLQVRFQLPEEDVVAVAGQALDNSAAMVDTRGILANAFRDAIQKAEPYLTQAVLTPDLRNRLQHLVAFVTKARAGVVRDGQGQVMQPPIAEGPGRLTKQLAAAGCALAALRGDTQLSEVDYRLVERLAFNSIPEVRSRILWALYDDGARQMGQFRAAVAVTEPTIRKHLEDLTLLGLAAGDCRGSGYRADYWPTSLGEQYLRTARGQDATQ